ncbi:fungal-specific transcription factor domain-containing protein [Irpex rosettiformis]|uniref:Fungal-specific transcription factor domain-containing protein n=1 Tax=Irpex rosettiformis TaxID=378272 RepID=A0ACB8UC12_9APHY|nr:fungal-specific transcription factor domain-containing protein [Irpex rosettiformis]
MSSPEVATAPQPNGSPGEPKKRKRGAMRLSCAECRRLKLRCDRQIPCGSCVKRGCAAICPDGSLQTGKGNRATRFVLPNTQDLHEKINELSNRVRELEDGLRTSHSQHSQDSHPLLSEELLRIKAPLQREGLGASSATTNGDENGDVVEHFGSLAISDNGRTSYFGQATGSFYFLQNEEQQQEEPRQYTREDRATALKNLLPAEVLSLAGLFPVAPNIPPNEELDKTRMEKLLRLYWCLPPAEEAADLRHIYFQHAAWMYNIMSLEQFNEHVYDQFYNPNAAPPVNDIYLSHQLGLMFMVLAIGSLMDIKRQAYNIEAEKYHMLSRAALFQSPIFEQPTISAVQALYLMAFYMFLSERHGSGVGSRWAFMGLAVKLGISVSLDRDAGRWNVEPSEIERRRQAFWELYSYDFLQSFTFGRPASFTLSHIDCKKPYTEDPGGDLTFHWWKHRFLSECMNTVYDQSFGAKVPTYNLVLQLDRKLRGFHVPAILQIAGFGHPDTRGGAVYDSVPLILQRHLVLAIREANLLYMHRGFFAKAISDHSKDPLGSPYGSSFIAAYRSAGSLVALVRNIHSQLKELSERMWFLWTHLFSCSIILGSIVTKCPSMSLAPSALLQLDAACDLFSKTAHIFHAEKSLSIMLNLREKARTSLTQFRNSPPSGQPTHSEPVTPVTGEDELSVLGGRSRLIASKEKSASPVIGELSPTTMNPIVPFPLKQELEGQTHPMVLEYLRTFASHSHAAPSHQQHLQQAQTLPMTSYEHTTFSDMTPISTGFNPSTSFSGQPMAAASPLEQMAPQQLPSYFPVFDYSGYVGPENTFSQIVQMSPETEILGRSYSPGDNVQNTWQELVSQYGGQL